MPKNLFLAPDASPAKREALAAYVAASDAFVKNWTPASEAAFRDAERALGSVLLAEDKERRTHIYKREEAAPTPVMATISERLRRGEEKYRSDRSIVYEGSTALGREAADTIDALVAALEAWRAAHHNTTYPDGHPVWAAAKLANAALARAKG